MVITIPVSFVIGLVIGYIWRALKDDSKSNDSANSDCPHC
jgi:hypothetical protein